MYPSIEKEFVLIGLCGLGRWLRSQARGERAPLRGPALGAVHTEAETVEAALRAYGIAPDLLCLAVRTAVGQGPCRHGSAVVHRSPACKACFQHAKVRAESVGSAEVHCLHLLAAILGEPSTLIIRVLTEYRCRYRRAAPGGGGCPGISAGPVRRTARVWQTGRPQIRAMWDNCRELAPETPYLDQYGYDLTQEAREGRIDPILGRQEEMLALVRTLHQKTALSPLLISAPGAGTHRGHPGTGPTHCTGTSLPPCVKKGS